MFKEIFRNFRAASVVLIGYLCGTYLSDKYAISTPNKYAISTTWDTYPAHERVYIIVVGSGIMSSEMKNFWRA